jgi:glycosyltransferase involved in cell wall biosynthesis
MARICMIAYTTYPADMRIRRDAEALVQRGDEVEIICPSTPELEGHESFHGVRVHTVTKFGCEDLHGPIDYIRPYITFLVLATIRLTRLFRKRRYDVIHVHTMPDFLVFSALIPKLFGCKVILDVHDLMPELYSSKFALPETHWMIRLVAAVERLSVRFADRAVAVHQPHLEALVRHGNPADKFTIVMNLPDRATFAPRTRAPDPPPFRLVYHGTVGRRHGLDIAVRAVALARDRVSGLELRVIGDGDYFPQLRELVRELDLEDCVRLEQGFVPVEQLLPMIDGATVGIVPILHDSFTRFMLPVKLIEYLALGVAVIASSSETIEAYFDADVVLLCPPGDPEALAARIVELHDSPSKRQALAVAGLRWSAEHDWEAQKRKYLDLVDSLLTTRGPLAVEPRPRLASAEAEAL